MNINTTYYTSSILRYAWMVLVCVIMTKPLLQALSIQKESSLEIVELGEDQEKESEDEDQQPYTIIQSDVQIIASTSIPIIKHIDPTPFNLRTKIPVPPPKSSKNTTLIFYSAV